VKRSVHARSRQSRMRRCTRAASGRSQSCRSSLGARAPSRSRALCVAPIDEALVKSMLGTVLVFNERKA